MKAKDFLDEYNINDLDVFSSDDEHFSLDNLMEEYAKIYHKIQLQKLSNTINYESK